MRPIIPTEALRTPFEIVCGGFAFAVPVYFRRGVYRCGGCHAELRTPVRFDGRAMVTL